MEERFNKRLSRIEVKGEIAPLLDYNDPRTAWRRERARRLSVDEMGQVVAVLSRVGLGHFTEEEVALVQRLIDVHQNLEHYATTTHGLIAHEAGCADEKFELTPPQ